MKAPRISIALISAAALAYEVLLMRLFSIIQWHHFAYMIISLALLGYGASGTFLSLARSRLMAHFSTVFIANLLMFSISSTGCFLLVQQLPFNPHEVLWDAGQLIWLSLIYLVLALPFFFAANCIGLALSCFSGDVSRLYAADLLGAGLGSVAIVAILFMTFPNQALLILGSLVALAALVAWWELGLTGKSRAAIGLMGMMVILPWLLPASWTVLALSPYKGLSQLLEVKGTRILDERSSPLGLISVVESTDIPLRHAPGLSLLAPRPPPEQLAVFTDGDGMTTITRYEGDREKLNYLDYLTSALPYHLGNPGRVLILGAGGGSDVLQARYFGAGRIDAVELNPQLVELLQKDHAAFSGQLFDPANSRIHIAEARGFVATNRDEYDLIQITLLDSFSASSAGLYALSESYLYTVEAFADYVSRLRPGGYLAISRWVKLPPRDTLKLFATAIASLQRMGVEDPGERLLLIRSWQTSTLLVRNGKIAPQDIEALKRFCEQRAFDPVYYPGIRQAEVNRYNILQQPYFYAGTQALLGEQRRQFMADYKFNLQPATDDQPYFFDFFKWRVVPEILSLRGQGGIPLLGMGYLILVATLIQAVVASMVLVLLPLSVTRRRDSGNRQQTRTRLLSLVYFSALGLAFLFIEIAFIQKFILFLHHPLYAVSVVLTLFLLFAGLGSAWSSRFVGEHSQAIIRGAIMGIVILGLAYAFWLEALFSSLMGLATPMKVLLSALMIAPLAFCMGIPFPMGLSRLSQSAPSLVPWVWGVNGCASVISAVLATLLAIHAGFGAVILVALGFYIVAAIFVPGTSGHEAVVD